MKKYSYYLYFSLLLLTFTNCRPTLELQSFEELPVVNTKSIQLESQTGVYQLTGKKYTFPGAISQFQYHPEWGLSSVNYKDRNRKDAYSIYNLKKEQLNWANKGNYNLALLQKEIAEVSFQGKKILINAQTSLPIRWVNGEEFIIIDDSLTLKLSKQFSRLNLETGNKYWGKQGDAGYTGWMSDELDGNWMYVVGNELHGFDLSSGQGWQHQVSTEYDASRGGRAIVNGLAIGINILSLAFGGYGNEVPLLEPMRAHNVFARPKIDGDQLYFADRKEIMSLEKLTGKVNWQKSLEEELGVSELKILSKDHLLLVGKGFRYVNYSLDKDKAARLFLVNKKNGRTIAKKELPNGEIIADCAINDAYIYTLSERKVYQFDQALDQFKSIAVPIIYGAPLRIISWSSSNYDAYLKTDAPDFPLVIRTQQGVLGLHPNTLEELWYQRLGSILEETPPMANIDQWQLPILINEMDARRSWIDESNEVFWFSKARKVIGLDLINNGIIVDEFKMPSDNFWFNQNGEIIEHQGQNARILKLKAK